MGNPFEDPYDEDGLPRQAAKKKWAPAKDPSADPFAQPGMPQPGVQQHYPVVSQQGGLQPVSAAGKNKVLAAVFALFLGQFGIHNFYLGNRERGIGQLVLFGATFVPIIHLVSVPVLVVWVTVEFILILLDVGSYNTKGPS